MIAILEAYRSGLLHISNWGSNIVSGLVVGVVALPLSMAFAIASGAEPAQGLYTAIVAGIIGALFGGSRVQISGPTGAFIVILAGITAEHGIIGLQIATFIAGFILLLMGFIKLGSVIRYIPESVIVGFTSGIAVIIFVGEWKNFFGLPADYALDASFHEKLFSLIQIFPYLDDTTTGIAMLSLFLLWLSPKFFKRIPAPLIALTVATSLQYVFQFETVATIGSTFGGISSALPTFKMLDMEWSSLFNLFGAAMTIALLGAIESLLSASVADSMAKTQHHSNQELIGQGIANIFAPLFGGFASTGAIARTATNVRNGGNSPLASIVHALFLILVIVFLSPLAEFIPLCALAAILFMVAYNMSDIPHFVRIVKTASSQEVLVLLTTFLLTVFTNLVLAVCVGVMLAMFFRIFLVREKID